MGAPLEGIKVVELASFVAAQKRYQNTMVNESAYWALKKTIESAEAQRERLHGGETATLSEAVEIDGVTLAYREDPVLDDLSLRIPAGEITALTGPSGAGKTTLVDLVSGLVEPDAGCVRIDGVPLDEIRDALRPSAGHYLRKTAPQQQAGRRQDVIVVVDDEDGADLAHCHAPGTVRNRTLAVRMRTVLWRLPSVIFSISNS